MNQIQRKLQALHACNEAIEWAGGFDDELVAWNVCDNGEWMLWLIGRTTTCDPWTDGRKPLTACCLDCAAADYHLWSDEEKATVEVMRAWIRGEASAEQANYCRKKIPEYTTAAYAAFVAVGVFYLADIASGAVSRSSLSQCANIVRKHFPFAPKLGGEGFEPPTSCVSSTRSSQLN